MIKLVLTETIKKHTKILKGEYLFMTIQDNFSTFEISRADTFRFRSIVIELMTEAAKIGDADEEYGGIGTLSEKQMHAAIKRFICPDESCHEIPLDNGERAGETDESGNKIKRRKFVADILKNGNVYEIQTGALPPLSEKIKWILENTSHTVTVIHPIAETKWVNVLDKNNDLERRYRSSLKGKLNDIAPELYAFKDVVESPRFSLVILFMEAEQYIKAAAKKGRSRQKYKKYELIPVNLLRAQVFRSLDDYKIFIPDTLEGEFTVKEFSAKSKIRGRDAYLTVYSLCNLGLLEECGKIGRAKAFRKTY